MKRGIVILGVLVGVLMLASPVLSAPAGGEAPAPKAAPAPAAAPEKAGEAAAEPEEPKEALVEQAMKLWRGGGYTMYLLLASSVLGVAFVLERLFTLRQSKVVPFGLSDQVRGLWQKGDMGAVEEAAKRSRSTLGRVILILMRHRGETVADIFTRAEDVGGREIRRHHQRAYPLAVVATISPMLGLMGTIFGMMRAFKDVHAAKELANPAILAGGIYEALITTATGLIIAVPVLAFWHYFRSRTNRIGLILEDEVSGLISDWFGKGERP